MKPRQGSAAGARFIQPTKTESLLISSISSNIPINSGEHKPCAGDALG